MATKFKRKAALKREIKKQEKVLRFQEFSHYVSKVRNFILRTVNEKLPNKI